MEGIRIMQALHDDVHKAKERCDVAFTSFKEIVSDVMSGLPHLDGSERIGLASREYKRALEAFNGALFKLNDYVIRGRISPDLQSDTPFARKTANASPQQFREASISRTKQSLPRTSATFST